MTDKILKNGYFQTGKDIDGGWGWLVSVSLGILMMLMSGPMAMFVVIYSSLLENEGIESKGVAAIFSTFITTYSVGAVLVQYFQKTKGTRSAALTGSFLVLLGYIVADVASSYSVLLLSYGGLVGLGFGLSCTAAVSSQNEHFDKRRTVAMALAHVINVCGCLAYPHLVQLLLRTFGQLGMRLMLTALVAHAFPASLLLRSPRNKNFRREIMNSNQLEDAHLLPVIVLFAILNTDILKPVLEPYLEQDKESKASKSSQCTDFSKRLRNILDSDHIRLFGQLKFLNLSLGVGLILALDSVFFVLQPLYLLNHLHMPLDDMCFVVVATGGGDLVGRALLMIFGKYLAKSNQKVYCFAAVCSAIGIAALVVATDLVIVTVISASTGMFRGMIYVTSYLVFSENYSVDVFPAAVANVMAISAVGQFILGPLLGTLRDWTGSYIITFVVIAALIFGCTIFWLVEAVCRRMCSVKNLRCTELAA